MDEQTNLAGKRMWLRDSLYDMIRYGLHFLFFAGRSRIVCIQLSSALMDQTFDDLLLHFGLFLFAGGISSLNGRRVTVCDPPQNSSPEERK